MKHFYLLLLLALVIDYVATDTDYKVSRFKRGAGQSRPARRSVTSFSARNFFGPGRNERLCSTRLNTGRLKSQVSNNILELVVVKEEKNVNAREGLQSVNFFEEYDIRRHGRVNENQRLRAYYFPYMSGVPGTSGLGVGWVDIPRRPTGDQPRIAITGGMNGCATVIMSVRNQQNTMRVYHLQSPGPRGGDLWNSYIQTIRNFHANVVDIINTFTFEEDYGYDHQTEEAFSNGQRMLRPEATILLHYDSRGQEWYYASQMNQYGMRIYDQNNNAGVVANVNDMYFNGKTYKTLYAQLTNRNNRPDPQLCDGFYPYL